MECELTLPKGHHLIDFIHKNIDIINQKMAVSINYDPLIHFRCGPVQLLDPNDIQYFLMEGREPQENFAEVQKGLYNNNQSKKTVDIKRETKSLVKDDNPNEVPANDEIDEDKMDEFEKRIHNMINS
jgi:hypothetical protein